MRVSSGDIVELWVDNLTFGGQGIARLDGLAVFVKGALPGDRVLAVIIKKKKAYAEARMIELLYPSPERIESPCPYFRTCGGCQWQNLRYERQLEYKKRFIQEAMDRVGLIKDIPVNPTIPSERTYAYRNKMEFSFSDRPWVMPSEFKTGVEKRGLALGLHVPGTFNKIIDMEACLLQHDLGNQILRVVKDYALNSRLPAYNLKEHKGFWRFLVLRRSEATGEWMVNVVSSEENQSIMSSLAEKLIEHFKGIRTVVNQISTKKAAIAVGEKEIVVAGDGCLGDRIGPYSFQISAGSFFQTNSIGAENLYQKVMEYSELEGSETVLDLYSGTGTISIFLSGCARQVIGMEIVRSAIKDAEINCQINRVSNCRFILGDIKKNLKEVSIKPDVLIIDPPRAGIHKDVLRIVMDMAVKRVVYVSCNPATMARDIGHMASHYEIQEIQPVDMFPQTYHTEAVAKLRLKKVKKL
jgi:23S rRNA (uracil1939-C5)-methyltransferase